MTATIIYRKERRLDFRSFKGSRGDRAYEIAALSAGKIKGWLVVLTNNEKDEKGRGLDRPHKESLQFRQYIKTPKRRQN